MFNVEERTETITRIVGELPALIKAVRDTNTNVLGLPCTCDTPELHEPQCLSIRELIHKLDALVR